MSIKQLLIISISLISLTHPLYSQKNKFFVCKDSIETYLKSKNYLTVSQELQSIDFCFYNDYVKIFFKGDEKKDSQEKLIVLLEKGDKKIINIFNETYEVEVAIAYKGKHVIIFSSKEYRPDQAYFRRIIVNLNENKYAFEFSCNNEKISFHLP